MSEHAQELVSIAVTLLAISNPKGIAVVIVCAGFFLIQMFVLGAGGRYLIPILFPLGTYIAVGKMSVMGIEKSKSSSLIVFSPKGPGRCAQPPKQDVLINPMMINVLSFILL